MSVLRNPVLLLGVALCLLPLLLLGVALCLLPRPVVAQSGEKPAVREGYSKLRIEVTAGEKDEPVENASVYVRYKQVHKLAKDKKIEMNLKTNHDGIAKSPEVPRGKVLVQVIASGWKTFGQWYEIDQAEQTIKIHLQKPPRWY